MPITGLNKIIETNIDYSMFVNLKFYGLDDKEIINYQLPTKMDIYIARDPWYKYPNWIHFSQRFRTYETIYYNQPMKNAFISFELSSNTTLNYVILFNYLPNGNLDVTRYDKLMVMCVASKF